jgi:hypothetical protein
MWKARISCSALILAVGLVAAACGSDDDEGGVSGETCESNCERRLAAGCSQTPAGFLEDCKSYCIDARSQVGEQCLDELAAAYSCVANKVTFSCDTRGFVVRTPEPGAACAAQAEACTNCSGRVVECNRL